MMDCAANEKYFKETSIKGPIVLIVIGLICFMIQPILAIVLIAAGAAWIYFSMNKISDEAYDKGVASNIHDMKKRALNKLGLDESEVQEIEPITIDGYRYSGASRFKKGKDNLWRTNKYEVAMLFFAANEVHCYKYSFSTTEDQHTESTDVYFYQDIVTVSTASEEASIPGQTEKANYEAFVLRTAGGNALDVAIRDYDNAQRSINAMRQLLRQKKA